MVVTETACVVRSCDCCTMELIHQPCSLILLTFPCTLASLTCTFESLNLVSSCHTHYSCVNDPLSLPGILLQFIQACGELVNPFVTPCFGGI